MRKLIALTKVVPGVLPALLPLVLPLVLPMVLSLALLIAAGSATAQDRNLGRNLAAQCANCHGTNGNAQPGGFPLAGRERNYIIDQMTAFKSGARSGAASTIMHQLSKGYSDEQVALMADYFAAQKPAAAANK